MGCLTNRQACKFAQIICPALPEKYFNVSTVNVSYPSIAESACDFFSLSQSREEQATPWTWTWVNCIDTAVAS